MLERDPKTLARLQTVLTELIEHRVSTSLGELEKAIARWRTGQHSALAAHGAVLRHAARCERTVERVTAAATDWPEGILRDAVDAGLMTVEDFVELVGKQPAEIESIRRAARRRRRERARQAAHARAAALARRGARARRCAPRRGAGPRALLPGREPHAALRVQPRSPDPHLTVDDECIAGTLEFSKVPFRVVLPWTAVYAAVLDGEQRGTVWPEDVPEDMLSGNGVEPATSTMPHTNAATSAVPTPTPRAPSQPTIVEDEPRVKRGAHLKLVD